MAAAFSASAYAMVASISAVDSAPGRMASIVIRSSQGRAPEVELSDADRYTVRHKLAIYFCIRARHTGKELYIYRVPRGNPHKPIIVRLDRALEAEARELAGPRGFSAAVTEGLRWWVARQKRRRGKGDPLAVAPPTAREIAGRKEPAA